MRAELCGAGGQRPASLRGGAGRSVSASAPGKPEESGAARAEAGRPKRARRSGAGRATRALGEWSPPRSTVLRQGGLARERSPAPLRERRGHGNDARPRRSPLEEDWRASAPERTPHTEEKGERARSAYLSEAKHGRINVAPPRGAPPTPPKATHASALASGRGRKSQRHCREAMALALQGVAMA